MNPRYNWPPQGYQNGQYVPYTPQHPNGYQPNGYPAQYPPQQMQMPHGYSQSQPVQSHPQVVIPPRSSQPYQQPSPNNVQFQHQAHQRQVQPQVVIPARNPQPMPFMQMQAPRIRQVQMPVQRSAQGTSGGVVQRNASHGQQRPPNAQQPRTPSVSKPVERSQSHQENAPRPQQRSANTPVQNQNQHRAPLQPHSTPQQRAPPQMQTPTSQHRSPSVAQSSSQVRSHPQVVIKKPSQQLHTPTKPQHAPPKALPVDLVVLLLSAADEYINVARSLGSTIALQQKEADRRQYYKLMATGLGCMETVLRKYNQTPRDEAKLRLRYINLLIEETDNNDVIEEHLAKGINLCKRSNLVDLKFAMLHLQARYQFKSKPRSALKLLDGPISEAETFQHVVWVYALRFLKVCLALQVPGRPETTSTLQQLHAIAKVAERRGDRAIFVTCSALEAMIHLRSTAPDHLEHAQRAIAAARSLQLQTSAEQLGQVAPLIDMVDVACGIQKGQPNPEKLKALQDKVDTNLGPENGVFSVLIERSMGGNITSDTGGVFRKTADGRDALVFSWLPLNEFAVVAYYLSGAMPNERSIKYLQEGHRLTQSVLRKSSSFGMSINAALNQRNLVKVLDWHLKFAIGLVASYQEDVPFARKALTMLRERVTEPPFEDREPYTRMLSYLSGVLDQHNGSFELALATYSTPVLALPESGSANEFKTDIAILAAMNRLLIIRNRAHAQNYLTGVLFAQLEPFCNTHPNSYIEAAFKIIRAIMSVDDTIARQKTLCNNACYSAQATQNVQLITIGLDYMTEKFFLNQVSPQAIKSIKATRFIAKKIHSPIWKAVAYGLCVSTLRHNGLFEDAQGCQEAFEQVAHLLPPALKVVEGVGVDTSNGVSMGDIMMN